jgi:cytochrome c oxidase assembly protein subunit 15
MPVKPSVDLPSRVPHRVAIILACVIFPLIWAGTLVTTSDAGMAVPDWPGTYGYNLFLYPLREWFFGPWDLFVEHGHRLLGALAGMVAIGLVFASWYGEPRKWVFGFSAVILAAISFQGVLGGARVNLDERVLAKFHGCFGPATFAAVVAFCVVTSRWWHRAESLRASGTADFRPASVGKWLLQTAIALVVVSYFQLFLGASIRHINDVASPVYFQILVVAHLITAAVILLGALVLVVQSLDSHYCGLGFRRWTAAATILVVGQILLGITTWVVRFNWPVWFENIPTTANFVVPEKTMSQVNLITAHAAVGSLVLAVFTVLAIRSLRLLGLRHSPDCDSGGCTVGAANHRGEVEGDLAQSSYSKTYG